MSGHPTYKRWRELKQRVRFCKRWNGSFTAFLDDLGEAPRGKALVWPNRKKPAGPGNAYWGSPEEAALFRKNARLVTCDGLTMSISQWARKLSVSRQVLDERLKAGWTDEEVVRVPVSAAGKRQLALAPPAS